MMYTVNNEKNSQPSFTVDSSNCGIKWINDAIAYIESEQGCTGLTLASGWSVTQVPEKEQRIASLANYLGLETDDLQEGLRIAAKGI